MICKLHKTVCNDADEYFHSWLAIQEVASFSHLVALSARSLEMFPRFVPMELKLSHLSSRNTNFSRSPQFCKSLKNIEHFMWQTHHVTDTSRGRYFTWQTLHLADTSRGRYFMWQTLHVADTSAWECQCFCDVYKLRPSN